MDCYYCIDKMEMILSYVLNKEDEKDEEFWLEDLFLYHLCKANLFSYENNLVPDKGFTLGIIAESPAHT